MRTDIDNATLNYLNARKGTWPRTLLWIEAKNRDTGATETAGFWNGDDHQSFLVGLETRLYYAAGAMLNMDDITYAAGFTDNRATINLSSLHPAVEQAVRGYDLRFAPVEVHRVRMALDSGKLVAPPISIFTGQVDTVNETEPPMGQSGATFELKLSSMMRRFQRTLADKHSAKGMNEAGATGFGKYLDMTGKVIDTWVAD